MRKECTACDHYEDQSARNGMSGEAVLRVQIEHIAHWNLFFIFIYAKKITKSIKLKAKTKKMRALCLC